MKREEILQKIDYYTSWDINNLTQRQEGYISYLSTLDSTSIIIAIANIVALQII